LILIDKIFISRTLVIRVVFSASGLELWNKFKNLRENFKKNILTLRGLCPDQGLSNGVTFSPFLSNQQSL
jgi:hypothetical protein